MTGRKLYLAAGAGLLAALCTPAFGGVVLHQLGEQDFANGEGPISVAQVKAAGANEALPFNGKVFGDDRNPRFGKIDFSYNFAPSPTASDGALTLGLIGLDSAPGTKPTVKLYLNGIEQPNAPFAGVSPALYHSSASVVTVPVAADLLTTGVLKVEVKAYRHSPGFPGNAIEADFSTLAVNDSAVAGGDNGSGGNGNGGIGGDGSNGTGNGGTGSTDPGGSGGGTGGGHPGDGNGTGNGGGGPIAVPVPAAAYTGILGLLIVGFRRRKWLGRAADRQKFTPQRAQRDTEALPRF